MKYYFLVIQSILIASFNFNTVYGAEAGMPQLDPEFWSAQIFSLILSFAIIFICVWKIILPKITKNIENRKSIIMHDLHDAEKLKEDAEKKLNEYTKFIEKAENEAKKIISDSKKNLQKELDQKKQLFENEVEKEIQNVEKQIKNFQVSSFSKTNQIAKEIAKSIMKKIIGAEVNESNLTAVIESTAKKMEKN